MSSHRAPSPGRRRRIRVGRALSLVLTSGVLLIGSVAVLRAPETAPSSPPTRTAAAETEVSGVSAERQTAVLAAEDERLLTAVAARPPLLGGAFRVQSGGVSTLVLPPGTSYGLADLQTLGALVTDPDGTLLLVENVFVAPGGRLDVNAPGSTLRLSSSSTGFTSIVAWKASLDLSGADGAPLTITSWDTSTQASDVSQVDGRAYVRDVSGSMSVQHVDISDLGFWAGRTSGVAWTGSSSVESTGSISDSTFTDNHYGAFASRVEGLQVQGSVFADNAVDGLSLHRGTAETTVSDTRAQGNGRHGFAADLGSESVTYTGVVAAGNAEAGISFSGSPLADGQTANGASLRTYGNIDISGGTVRDNGSAGIRVVDGNHVSIEGTQVLDNRDGIMLRGTAAPTTITGTTVGGDQRFGITVRGGSADVSGNQVDGAVTAIRVADAAVTVTDNSVLGATAHAISIVGAANGSAVTGNDVAGRGPSALDLYRLADGVQVTSSGNDVEGWARDRDDWTYWSTFIPNHPMLLLWVALLGAPLLMTLRARRHEVTRGVGPYQDGKREWRPQRVHVGRRIDLAPQVAGGGQA